MNNIELTLMRSIGKILNKTKNAGPEEKAAALTALLRISSSMAIVMGVEYTDYIECCSELYMDVDATAKSLND